jgi:O-antigen/teichoic acid export membrane protein
MNLHALLQRLSQPKYRYMLVTILASLLAFARNLFFMKSLDLASLGQITLMTTLIMLVGFVHGGLINGAYLQYAARDREINRHIVELMATGTLVLVPIAGALVWALQQWGALAQVVWPGTLAFGLAAGIVTLASTWLNNALIADGHLGRSNLINVGAVMLSMVAAYFSTTYGLTAAWLSLLIQPLVIALGAMLIDSNLRVRTLGIRRDTLVLLLRLGLVPFLGGLAVLSMQQFERWSIAAILGPKALGEFYLVLMYTTFFGLVPASLANFYFPQAKRAFIANDLQQLNLFIRHHQRDLMLYFGLAAAATVLLMPPTLERYLPEFAPHASLVNYALPGLVLLTLRNIASMVLFSTSEMRPLLVAGIGTLVLFGLSLLGLWAAGIFTLANILIARAVAIFPGTALLLLAQHQSLSKLRKPADKSNVSS